MVFFKQIRSGVGLLLGFLGVLVCVAGIVAVWKMGSWVSRTNEQVFAGVDRSVATVRDQVLGAQLRVQELRVATRDIGPQLMELTKKKAEEGLAERFELEKKAERLALGLQQADLWLEMSGASIQSVRQVLELGYSLGAPVNADLIDNLIDELASLRSQLKEAAEAIEQTADIVDGRSRAERMEQTVELVLRVTVAIGDVESLLGEWADKLSETQVIGQQLKSKIHSYIFFAQLGVALILAWMAAGQASLCLHGWQGLRLPR